MSKASSSEIAHAVHVTEKCTTIQNAVHAASIDSLTAGVDERVALLIGREERQTERSGEELDIIAAVSESHAEYMDKQEAELADAIERSRQVSGLEEIESATFESVRQKLRRLKK